MKNEFDVIALGELLIDFTPAGVSELGFPFYECNPGGAPANVLIAVSRQGGNTAFIGKVGNDNFGKLLKKTLNNAGVNTNHIRTDSNIPTTMAFVSLDKKGNRSFSFARNPGADIMLQQSEVDKKLIQHAKIFHFGSISCTDEPSRSATLHALKTAQENNLIISYDPNLRLPLWETANIAKDTILSLMKYANIVKICDEEFEFLTGTKDYEQYAQSFMQKYSIDLLFVTLGSKGAYYQIGDMSDTLCTYDAKVTDTTGSGDTFVGTILYKISKLNKKLTAITKDEIENIVDHANAAGSMATTKKGGIPSIPTTSEILSCIKNVKKLEEKQK